MWGGLHPPALDYESIEYADIAASLGKRVRLVTKIGQAESSGFYVPWAGKADYLCWRSPDMQNFIYARKGSPAAEAIAAARREGAQAVLYGTLVDIKEAIWMAGKHALVVDRAEPLE